MSRLSPHASSEQVVELVRVYQASVYLLVSDFRDSCDGGIM